MTDKKNVDEIKSGTTFDFLKELKEFAITVGEDCPEGHRRDPKSGACLPMGGIDHTAFTRSKNVDDGPEWRGEVDKTNTTFAGDQETAIDSDEMDEPESCAEGTTFSFVQRKCIPTDEAEVELEESFARDEEGHPILIDEEETKRGHEEVIALNPEGRQDPANFECPNNEFFDSKLGQCIPLSKDTVMASEDFSEEFKKAVATFARLAMTSPDPLDGHRHVATLDLDGNGVTSIAGFTHSHSHEVKKFIVIPRTEKAGDVEYTSQHPGFAVPEEHRIEKLEDFGSQETAAPLKGGQRKALPDSAFGVPGKRKFPLDTCGRVRNAMARFNQGKGLTSGEKATLRRKILARAKACGIEVRNFGKATTDAEFSSLTKEMIKEVLAVASRLEAYRATSENQGPCPPGMKWDVAENRCGHTQGFVDEVALQPEGRRDPVGFQCPEGWFFDFTNRRCLPLDPSQKPGTTTTEADEEEDGASRVLTPQPAGRPVRLPIDCPEGTIWSRRRQDCIPLDSSKKTKSAEEEEQAKGIPPQFLKNIKKKKGKNGDDEKNGKNGKKGGFPDFLKKKKSKSEEDETEDATKHGQTPTNGPGKKGGPGCPEGQFMNPVTKKCMPRKGAFKGKSDQEEATHANPGNREGLTKPPAGKVQHPSDCPDGTAWDAKSKVCRPIDTRAKNRPAGSSPQPATSVAEAMSTAQLIQQLDEIIKENAVEKTEKSRIAAKDLPHAAFPPSLVSPTRRSLMHHTPGVEDPYDTLSVDVARLRNSLFRAYTIEGFSAKAIEDAQEHLLFHAREIVKERVEKKD